MHDYHMHSHFCRHATGSLEEYARACGKPVSPIRVPRNFSIFA